MGKKRQVYVLAKLIDYIFAITRFDLWMFKGVHDVFALVINLLGFDWQPKLTTIGFLQMKKTIGQTLVNNLTKLVDQYGLETKALYVLKMKAQI